MKREEIIQEKKLRILDEISRYDFPHLLFSLRYNLGISRRKVAEEIDISDMRLFYLEHGKFSKAVLNYEVRLLSDYYDIDYEVLKTKADEFYTETQPSDNELIREAV